jgi:integrase
LIRRFPARGNDEADVSGFTRAKTRIDKVCGVTGWTLHDLRRSTATFLGKLKTPPHVIERILNHVSGSFAGVAGVYNRHPYFDEMSHALELWGETVSKLAAGSAGCRAGAVPDHATADRRESLSG